MGTPLLAEIRVTSFNFAPKGWAMCNGQLLAINQNQALFSLLGTTYGGDGRQTFALPNLQGSAPIHWGTGLGNTIQFGEKAGAQTTTLTVGNLPSHTHTVTVNNDGNNIATDTANNYLNSTTASGEPVASTGSTIAALNTGSVGSTGLGIPVNIMPPYLVLNYVIALVGIFPSRN